MSEIASIGSSLDGRTKLVRAPWRARVFPDAGEAVVTRRVTQAARHGSSRAVEATDFDSAGARAARQARRYCASNSLAYLWTATYAGDGTRDHFLVRANVHALFRSLRLVVGKRFPYLWTTEWHPGGHGLHVHFAVAQFIKHAAVADAWGQGHVWVRGPGHEVVGAEARDHGRRVARYVAKYVAKAPAAPAGYHRYEVAQGFRPRELLLGARDLEEAIQVACAAMGALPTRLWDSATEPKWMAPRTLWLGWP